jgi:VWFA-related protein
MRIVLVLALALTAAEPQAPEPPAGAPRVIDVIAADSRGRPVDTLTPVDFSVVEQGVPQTVASARFVRDDIRLFGIFLDEFHTTPGDAVIRVRDALVRFVKTDLGPGDRIAVVKPLDSLLAITLLDRDAAANAIQTLEGRQGDYAPRTSFERNYIAGAPGRINAARNQISVSALNALATHLGASGGGRKTLLVVSGGIPRQRPARGDEPLPTLDTVVHAANRAQVSIYPIEIGGGADGDNDLTAREALRGLATETAGRAIPPAADLAVALKGVLADSSGYYAITLGPNGERADDQIHPVDIRVARRDVALRARRGYWAAEPERAASRAADPAGPASRRAELARRTSPLIRPWFGLARGSGGTTRVSFVWEPVPGVPGERSRAQPPARVALNVSRADSGAPVFDGVVLPAGRAADGGSLQDARAVFELPPGRLRVQMSIEDAASHQLDTDVRDLVVGGFSGPLTLGTSRVLRARNAREYRAIAGNPDATPVAVRQFSRAERLIVRVPVYASGGQPTVVVRLLSRFGAAMRNLEVSEAPGTEGYQLDLPLAGLASGDYAIEFTARNEDGEVKDTLAIRVTP